MELSENGRHSIQYARINPYVPVTNHPDFVALRSGRWTNGFTQTIADALSRCEDLCFKLNNTLPSNTAQRESIIREIIDKTGSRFVIHNPFHCDFGFNIRLGENFVGNFNLTILDEAEVCIGDNAFIGPNTTLCTIIHDLDAAKRNSGLMCARPITIHSNVWIASNVTILPGVTIGEGAVVGAGSVVTHNVAPYTLVAGNPARPIKSIDKNV